MKLKRELEFEIKATEVAQTFGDMSNSEQAFVLSCAVTMFHKIGNQNAQLQALMVGAELAMGDGRTEEWLADVVHFAKEERKRLSMQRSIMATT